MEKEVSAQDLCVHEKRPPRKCLKLRQSVRLAGFNAKKLMGHSTRRFGVIHGMVCYWLVGIKHSEHNLLVHTECRAPARSTTVANSKHESMDKIGKKNISTDHCVPLAHIKPMMLWLVLVL